ADVAQLVEQLICNQQVKGSSPFVSSNPSLRNQQTPRAAKRGVCCQGKRRGRGRGGVPERPKGADCKSAALSATKVRILPPPLCGARRAGARGRSSVGRASAFQAEGHGFEPRRPLLVPRSRRDRGI